ncbi:MAG: polyprenyl diphosphate synthase [Thermodesulfovibrionales bacterium]|nr:polyprenyl diphosphate synthase [Thermodesulfovibrionales bacterium]
MGKRTIPRHIGIIMDGNGRWAEMRGLPRLEGHKRGVARVREIIETAYKMGIEALTLYAFSIENWQRPQDEVSIIMDLFHDTLLEQHPIFIEKDIRFKLIGDRKRLSVDLINLIDFIERTTANNRKLVIQCALSYSGRDELVRAIRKIIDLKIPSQNIHEDFISQFLDTAGIPDPDFLIRTSGEQRISNFLLWQSAYAEFYFTPTLWPDFTKEEFLEAIYEYQSRERRFGKIYNRALNAF